MAARTVDGPLLSASPNRETVDQSGPNPLVRGRGDVVQQRPTLLVTSGVSRYPDEEIPQGVERVDPGEDPALAVFWQLLRNVGYYTW